MDLALIPRMDAVLRLPGESNGADGETALAQQLGIPVCEGWSALDAWLSNAKGQP